MTVPVNLPAQWPVNFRMERDLSLALNSIAADGTLTAAAISDSTREGFARRRDCLIASLRPATRDQLKAMLASLSGMAARKAR